MSEQWAGPAGVHGNGEYAAVNGIELYYETHGSGAPLVLLHGGLGSGEMFGATLTALAAEYTVILPDLQGHGRTADIDRPVTMQAMGDDIAALIGHLGLDRPAVVGYSLGGGAALQLAARHPHLVGRLVMVSAGIRRNAMYPDILAQQEQMGAAAAAFMTETPMYELYHRVAPRPEDFPRLLDKLADAMRPEFDHGDLVRGLSVPTLVMAGDADLCPPAHFVEIFALLDGGQRDGGWDRSGRPAGGHALSILPGATHYDIVENALFAPTVLEFLR